MYLRRRLRVKQQSDRRNVFLRYLGEVATAVSQINEADRDALYEQLLSVAKKRTAEADMQLDDRGRRLDEEELDLGANVLIVEPSENGDGINRHGVASTSPETSDAG
jgi:DNA topoisomerase-6 subunit B